MGNIKIMPASLPERSPVLEPFSIVRAYAELVRLPNLFTAMADIVMGFLFTHPHGLSPGDERILGLLLGASTALYAAGVVLNDVFDFQTDLRERPGRPLPSGRVSLPIARVIGWGLLAVGVALGAGAARFAGAWWPGIVAAALAGCVLFYDGFLKKTLAGPLGMGACRMLNVLLGMSALRSDGAFSLPWDKADWLVAGALGLYIVGVTWFAQGEAGRSKRLTLAMATAVMLVGIGLLYWLPAWVATPVPMLQVEPWRWTVFLGALAGYTAFRGLLAIRNPGPQWVQMTVTGLIHTLVFLDAAACFVVQDIPGAFFVLLFVFPASLLGHWLYST